jgi:hypothetical protein
MMRAQPAPRVLQIRASCDRLGVPLRTALSLRRHHINMNHRGRSADVMQLGSQADLLASATPFEEAIAEHLRGVGVAYIGEAEQKARAGTGRGVSTPDFLLRSPLTIRTTPDALDEASRAEYRRDASDGLLYTEKEFADFYRDGGRAWVANAPPRASAHASGSGATVINWVEAKWFYGASTVPMDGKSAVGKLHAVVDKYVRQFGPGALVLGHGCGAPLAAELEARGALVLDSSPLDLTAVHAQMATWCAGESGELLP